MRFEVYNIICYIWAIVQTVDTALTYPAAENRIFHFYVLTFMNYMCVKFTLVITKPLVIN